MPTLVGMLPGDKTPVIFDMNYKEKPSRELGDIIKLLVIVKVVTAILHLLK